MTKPGWPALTRALCCFFGGFFFFFAPVLGRDISNIHTIYENNVVVNNTGDGIAHEISMDALVTGNIGCFNGYATQTRSMVVQAKLNAWGFS